MGHYYAFAACVQSSSSPVEKRTRLLELLHPPEGLKVESRGHILMRVTGGPPPLQIPSLLPVSGAQVELETLTLVALQLGFPPPFGASVREPDLHRDAQSRSDESPDTCDGAEEAVGTLMVSSGRRISADSLSLVYVSA